MRPDHSTLAQAQQLRNAGRYDLNTLRLFFRAWHKHPNSKTLVAWLNFQRDLGHPLRPHQYPWLRAVAERPWYNGWALGMRLRQQARLLCAEYEYTAGLSAQTDNRSRTEALRHQVEAQYPALLDFLRQQASGGIAIVGNSPTLHGQSLGDAIDRNAVVIRFNRHHSAETRLEDNGIKTMVWVKAPGYHGPVPDVPWMVLSGPAFHWRLLNWRGIQSALDNGINIAGIPLRYWRELVYSLKAPPSAGLLTAYWLTRQPELAPFVRLYGFGYDPANQGPYHKADVNHRPNDRHDWAAEAELFRGLSAGE